MSNSFAAVLEEARCGKPLIRVAEIMADEKGPKAKNLLGYLSKLQSGKRRPSKAKVEEISAALAELHELPHTKADRLRNQLMRAAEYGDPQGADLRAAAQIELSETEERRRLHPACYEALRGVPQLAEYEIQTILRHVGVPTMKLIVAAAERGEEIEVVQLQKISAELQQTAARYSGEGGDAGTSQANTIINAGRARILVDGEVSPAQMQVLRNAAEMIESVLKL